MQPCLASNDAEVLLEKKGISPRFSRVSGPGKGVAPPRNEAGHNKKLMMFPFLFIYVNQSLLIMM